MSTKRYWAKVQNEVVMDVIIASEEVKNATVDGIKGKWVECKKDGSIRKNMAVRGGIYSNADDAFADPKPPYASWTLNKSTYKWEAPVDYPDDGKRYYWDEASKSWKEFDTE